MHHLAGRGGLLRWQETSSAATMPFDRRFQRWKIPGPRNHPTWHVCTIHSRSSSPASAQKNRSPTWHPGPLGAAPDGRKPRGRRGGNGQAGQVRLTIPRRSDELRRSGFGLTDQRRETTISAAAASGIERPEVESSRGAGTRRTQTRGPGFKGLVQVRETRGSGSRDAQLGDPASDFFGGRKVHEGPSRG